jgi:hypothetical protein
VKDVQKMKMEYFMTASAFGMNPKVIQDNWDEYERKGYN